MARVSIFTGTGLLLKGVALAALLSAPACAYGATSVTLQDALRLALDTNEAVKIAGEGVEQARAGEGKALSNFLPALTLQSSYTRYSAEKGSGGFIVQPESSSRVDVTLEMPLFEGGRNIAGRRQATLATTGSRIGLNAAREFLILQTSRAYYNLLKAVSGVEIEEAALKRAVERRKVAQARLDVGAVTRAALLRAEAEVAGAEAGTTRARAAHRDAISLLKRFIGGVDGDITAVRPETLPAVSDGPEELIERAYASRRDYRRAVINEEVSKEGINYSKGHFLPSLSLQGNYNWREQSPSTTFLLENSASAAIVLTYPIFEGGLRKAELSEARSVLREKGLERAALKRDIEVQVREAYNNMDALGALIESYKRQVAFAEEDYKMVFEQFKHGIATTVDVIDADATLIKAQRSLLNALFDHEVSKMELRYAVGTLLDYVNMAASQENP